MSQAQIDSSRPPVVELTAHDLPVHCPNPQMEAWSSHPRVYIALDHGVGTCPYCGTEYRLKAGEKIASH
jgi:uncharacterized Zn-finger protein